MRSYLKKLTNYFRVKTLQNNDLYLVYTMSKVGSSTVYNSLKKKFPHKEIHHLHFLGDTWLNKFKSGHDIFKNNLKNAERFEALLKKRHWNIKIITLTRDPIARDVSGVFQAWQHIFDVDDITKVTANEIVSHLKSTDFSYASNWFETDFKEFTGIDIFQQSFDADKGYQMYECQHGSILIMQLEQLNDNFDAAMNAFLGKGHYHLQQENITEQRTSGELNKQVKAQLRLSKDRLDKIYDSSYCQLFYNTTQLNTFKEKWMKPN